MAPEWFPDACMPVLRWIAESDGPESARRGGSRRRCSRLRSNLLRRTHTHPSSKPMTAGALIPRPDKGEGDV
eukprot:7385343-Prymnesium_polylepis.5